MNEPTRILLVDGTCIFCNRLVQRILRWDRRRQFHFAHLQGSYARALLRAHGQEPDIDVIYLVDGVGTERERVLLDGAAGRVIWPALFWFAWPVRLAPLFALNLWYRLFARVRYRLFGQSSVCIVRDALERSRFLEEEPQGRQISQPISRPAAGSSTPT